MRPFIRGSLFSAVKGAGRFLQGYENSLAAEEIYLSQYWRCLSQFFED